MDSKTVRMVKGSFPSATFRCETKSHTDNIAPKLSEG